MTVNPLPSSTDYYQEECSITLHLSGMRRKSVQRYKKVLNNANNFADFRSLPANRILYVAFSPYLRIGVSSEQRAL